MITLEDYIKEIRDTVIVEIPKVSGINPRVSDHFKHINIHFSTKDLFIISTSGKRIDSVIAEEYVKELNRASEICKNLNGLMKYYELLNYLVELFDDGNGNDLINKFVEAYMPPPPTKIDKAYMSFRKKYCPIKHDMESIVNITVLMVREKRTWYRG